MLASCGGAASSNISSESSQEGDSSLTSSEENSSEVSLSSRGDIYIETSLERDHIPSGSSFFDTCRPTVMFHDTKKGTEEDVSEYTFRTEFKITNVADETKVYKAGDALPAGHYNVQVSFEKGKRYKDNISFTVDEVTPIEASEGKGYKTYTLDELQDTTFHALPNLDTLGGHGLPTFGNPKILVIPVEFTNATFENVRGDGELQGRDLVRAVLNEAFFAESEDTPWESLHSYYLKSSHGIQNITGTVTPVYQYPYADTDPEVVNAGSLAQTIVSRAVEWLRTEHAETFGNLTDYDSDKDGYIDGIEVVYATTHGTPSSAQGDDSNDTWWNYCTNAGGGSDVKRPGARRMFWSRWDYLTNGYYTDVTKTVDGEEVPVGYRVKTASGSTAVDAHTIIHETGHMQGAPDYYSYDKNEGVAGCVDMMDNNVGDHNAFTKMGYGWASPKVIDGSANNFTITLKSWTITGDFLIFRDSSDPWNETPWDEYIMLQYYTPEGVNEKDSTGYPEWLQASTSGTNAYGHGGTYKKEGLQVFHVDGRVASVTSDVVNGKRTNDVFAYTDDPKAVATYNEDRTKWESPAEIMHTNTQDASGRGSRDIDEEGEVVAPTKVREISIVLPSGVPSFNSSSYYNNFGNMTNLFGLDSHWGNPEATSADEKYGGFSYSNYAMRSFFPLYEGLKFNDGSTNNWNFEIVAQTEEDVTIHFINTRA